MLLFGGAATALAVIAVVGAAGDDTDTLVYVAVGWWVAGRRGRAVAGPAAGRHPGDRGPAGRGPRARNTLPELEPGAVLFNRLWPLAVLTVASGALGFLIPQVPADRRRLRHRCGAAVAQAVTGRSQAIEGRDGVRVLVRPQLALRAPQLLRLPGLRRIEPVPRRERR